MRFVPEQNPLLSATRARMYQAEVIVEAIGIRPL